MKYLLIAALLFVSTSVMGQGSEGGKVGHLKSDIDCQVIVDNKNPSAYLDCIRSDKGKRHLYSDSTNRVWLKLVNNSIWSIRLLTFSGVGGLGERGVFHRVEKIRGWLPPDSAPSGYTIPDTGFRSFEVLSGDSLLLSVPANHLSENLMVRIDFSYQWENREAISSRSLPTHSVTFTHGDLERSIRSKDIGADTAIH